MKVPWRGGKMCVHTWRKNLWGKHHPSLGVVCKEEWRWRRNEQGKEDSWIWVLILTWWKSPQWPWLKLTLHQKEGELIYGPCVARWKQWSGSLALLISSLPFNLEPRWTFWNFIYYSERIQHPFCWMLMRITSQICRVLLSNENILGALSNTSYTW